MHVLDNAVWHALTGPQTTVAQRVPLAARYEPEVSVFAALPDEVTAEAWDGLRDLVGPGNIALLARQEIETPPDWTVVVTRPCRQMVLPDGAPAGNMLPDGAAPADSLVPLGAGEVPEMLALVARTDPGPFVTRTVELGSYLGIRDGATLVAMAGERMHPPGFTEISAVCTDSAYRGRGLASRLIHAIVDGIRRRGETPCLHLTMKNEPAHRVYSSLGFETRTYLDVIAVRAPA